MANDLNSVVMVGRLTKDVETGHFQSGAAYANMSIAVNRSRKENESFVEDTSFFDCVLYGKRAESLVQYLKKGKLVAIKGYLKQERWEKDGQKKSRVCIVIDELQFVGGGQSEKKATGESTEFEEDVPF